MNTRDDELQADGDPRLTAYALGELDEAEMAEIETLLARDPAARAEVEAIRETARMLGSELHAETNGAAPALTPAQRSIIESEARRAKAPRRNPLRWAAPLAMAAALLIWVVWDNRDELAGTVKQRDLDKTVAMGEASTPAVPRSSVDQLEQLGYVGSRHAPVGYSGGGHAQPGMGYLGPAHPPAAPAAASAGAAGPKDFGLAKSKQADEQLLALTEKPKLQESASGEANPAESQASHQYKRVKDSRNADALAALPQKLPLNDPSAAAGAQGAPLSEERVRALHALGYTGTSTELTGKGRAAAPAVPAAASAPSFSSELETADDTLAVAARDGHDEARPVYRYLKSPPGAPGTESYQPIVEQDFQSPWTAPLSTFGVDVDTASYSNVRRFLNEGQLPPADAVRIEELVNYFRYDDPQPAADAPDGCPFGVTVQVAGAPWAPTHRLVRVALKGREVAAAARPSSNIVFLLDVSGSMSDADKLPLLKQCLALMTRQLDERDHVAIVVYAGAAGLVLDSTTCDDAGRQKVLDALDHLQAGGSTAGAAGIQLAYDTAAKTFQKQGTNRVVLCTDGDFNVGISDRDGLQHLIEGRAKGGVFLTVLGFGEGNLKDGTAELLADKGNGLYAYIDSLDEGRRVLVQQMGGSLITIAKDVKLQVEFNPAKVGAYRLLGYENRALAAQDFNDDRKDAGDIGAGHGVTALYELVPPGEQKLGVDPLKYQKSPPAAPQPELNDSDELLTVNLRWKQPDADASKKISVPVKDSGATLEQAPPDLRFAAAVAGFGMKLRGSDKVRDCSWEQIVKLAAGARGEDPDGWRAEFVRLASIAAGLQGEPMDPQLNEALKQLGYSGNQTKPQPAPPKNPRR